MRSLRLRPRPDRRLDRWKRPFDRLQVFLADASRRSASRGPVLCLGTKFEKPQQYLVSLCLQLINGARSNLRVDAVGEHLLDFGCQYGRPENLPPRCHRTRELLEKMLDAPLAAAEVVKKDLPHDAPTQARPPTQRSVYVRNADDAFGNKVVHLPPQSGLQTVGNMAGYFLVKANCPLPDRRIERRRALKRVFRGLCATDDLD